VFADEDEDVKVKQRSLDLASKTLHDNQIQVQIGTLAPIDLAQAETEVATRKEQLITAQYTIDQLQDQLRKLITNETDPGLVPVRLNLVEPLREPGSQTLLPLDKAIQFALENGPAAVLARLAEETGGSALFPNGTRDLTRAFSRINEELRSQYSLAYRPTNARRDGTYRAIRIVPVRKGYTVRYWSGYYAPDAPTHRAGN